ncbi:MAG: family 43 glycosylhydrolase [Clostridiales bacterium]|jgi:hypothetical protein|nr:family 43 glycosylhydrolase [Clostridiales bacterium]
MKKKGIIALLCCVLFAVAAPVGACGKKNDGGGNETVATGEKPLPHYDQLTEGQEYNRNLFYVNNLSTYAADPSIIYVDDGAEKGYFYMYATSDEIGASGYQAWRSKDLTNWECTGVAFTPDRDSWGRQNFWAPEVMYYRSPAQVEANEPGKYYMVYNAWKISDNYRHSIGLAVSDSPKGPFVQYTGTNSDGRTLTISDAFVETKLFDAQSPLYNAPLIDASLFLDDDGKLYLYFVYDIQFGATSSSIWGMPLKDIFTPDYSAAVQLTAYRKVTVDGAADGINELDKTNEGPVVLKHNGKYYLTFSTSQYFRFAYSSAQAIGDKPLGPFTKVALEKGGNFITALSAPGKDDIYEHTAGTGHHTFARVGDEVYAIYHAFANRKTLGNGEHRAIAVDKVSFVNNGEQEIIYCNGPSYSIQPLPAKVSGYANVAGKASVTATNAAEEGATVYLTTGTYKNHDFDYIKEFKSNGDTVITMTFGKAYDVKAIMIYNAFNYDEAFSKIDRIALTTEVNKDGASFKGDAVITDLGFDKDWYIYIDRNDPTDRFMRPGGSAIAEFDEIPVTKIVITINKSSKFTTDNDTIAVSDIVVLAKEA